MKARTILLVVLALICGGSAAVGVNQMRHGNGDPGTDRRGQLVPGYFARVGLRDGLSHVLDEEPERRKVVCRSRDRWPAVTTLRRAVR